MSQFFSLSILPDTLMIAEPGLVGLSWSDIITTGFKHPFIKSDWGTDDKLIGSMGNYYLLGAHLERSPVVQGGVRSRTLRMPAGAAAAGLTFNISGGDIGNVINLVPRWAIHAVYFNKGIASKYLVSYNRLIWNEYLAGFNGPLAVGSLLDRTLSGVPYFEKYMVTGFKKGDRLMEAQHHSRSPEAAALLTRARSGRGASSVTYSSASPPPGLLEGGSFIPGAKYYNRSTTIKLPSQSASDISSELISLTPAYNFYLNNNAKYESIIEDMPEAALPNFYLVHNAFNNLLVNGGLDAPRGAYRSQITLNDFIPWDNIVSQATKKSYYQLWTEEAQRLKNPQGIVSYDFMMDKSIQLYSHVEVNSSNLSILDDYDATIRDVPMFVEIRIDHRSDNDITRTMPGPSEPGQITMGPVDEEGRQTAMWMPALPRTDQNTTFVKMLKDSGLYDLVMNIIISRDTGLAPSERHTIQTFERQQVATQSPSALPGEIIDQSLTNSLETKRLTLPNGTIKWFMNLESLLDQLRTALQNSQIGMINHYQNPDNAFIVGAAVPGTTTTSFLANPTTAAGLNLIDPKNLTQRFPARIQNGVVIEPAQVVAGLPMPSGDSPFYPILALVRLQNWKATYDENIQSFMRDFEELLKLRDAYSETLLYKIEKRVVPSGTSIPINESGGYDIDPVQIFYLAVPGSENPFPAGTLKYIDSQVKYNTLYQYDVKQIRLVQGSQYFYNNINIGNALTGNGKAVGNALGMYKETSLSLTSPDEWDEKAFDTYTWERNDTAIKNKVSGYFVHNSTLLGFASANAGAMTIDDVEDVIDNQRTDVVKIKLLPGHGIMNNAEGGAVTQPSPFVGGIPGGTPGLPSAPISPCTDRHFEMWQASGAGNTDFDLAHYRAIYDCPAGPLATWRIREKVLPGRPASPAPGLAETIMHTVLDEAGEEGEDSLVTTLTIGRSPL